MVTDERAQLLAEIELSIENNEPQIIVIRGKTYKVLDIKDWVFDRIMKFAVPIMRMRDVVKQDEYLDDIEMQYKMYVKYRKNFAKISALFLLGHSNFKSLFLFPFYWRYVRLKFDTGSHYLLYEKLMNDKRLLFFYLTFQRVEAMVKTRMMMLKAQNETEKE